MAYSNRKRVGYFYDAEVGNYYYAEGHPMKPHRMRLTHNLLVAYGLYEKMDVLSTPRASDRDMTRFHSDEYINFIKTINQYSLQDQLNALTRFNVLEDCPVFDGLYEYCQIAAGGSLAGAAKLNRGESDVAINWAGGLHHAKKAEASGFCYINDCVLAILELLTTHARVLYVDIDIHHGDGVEEAFYTTDRVMTTSFHKFGDYFPGTGDVTDVGVGHGKNYSLNFPLRDGIDDETYREVFEPVMSRVMAFYRPGAVVLQCGADSLSGDRLGCFNLSLKGHAQCVDFFRKYDVPLLLLGGGGYTVRNVARCWAYETSRVVGVDLPDDLPFNENYEFYGPDFRLHITPSNLENHNSMEDIEKIKAQIFENLRNLPHAPSTPFMDTPRLSPMGANRNDEDTEEDDPDVRIKNRRARHAVDYAGSDDDDDDDQYISSLRLSRKRQRKMNFPSRRRYPTAIPSTIHRVDRGRVPVMSPEQYSPRRGTDPKPGAPAPFRMTSVSGAVDGGLFKKYGRKDVEMDASDKGGTGFSDRRELNGGLGRPRVNELIQAGDKPRGDGERNGEGASISNKEREHGVSQKIEKRQVGHAKENVRLESSIGHGALAGDMRMDLGGKGSEVSRMKGRGEVRTDSTQLDRSVSLDASNRDPVKEVKPPNGDNWHVRRSDGDVREQNGSRGKWRDTGDESRDQNGATLKWGRNPDTGSGDVNGKHVKTSEKEADLRIEASRRVVENGNESLNGTEGQNKGGTGVIEGGSGVDRLVWRGGQGARSVDGKREGMESGGGRTYGDVKSDGQRDEQRVSESGGDTQEVVRSVAEKSGNAGIVSNGKASGDNNGD